MAWSGTVVFDLARIQRQISIWENALSRQQRVLFWEGPIASSTKPSLTANCEEFGSQWYTVILRSMEFTLEDTFRAESWHRTPSFLDFSLFWKNRSTFWSSEPKDLVPGSVTTLPSRATHDLPGIAGDQPFRPWRGPRDAWGNIMGSCSVSKAIINCLYFDGLY